MACAISPVAMCDLDNVNFVKIRHHFCQNYALFLYFFVNAVFLQERLVKRSLQCSRFLLIIGLIMIQTKVTKMGDLSKHLVKYALLLQHRLCRNLWITPLILMKNLSFCSLCACRWAARMNFLAAPLELIPDLVRQLSCLSKKISHPIALLLKSSWPMSSEKVSIMLLRIISTTWR